MTNRKHHVKDKQITTLSGWFHSPLRVGERAIISGVNGFSILTSPMYYRCNRKTCSFYKG